jgi:hypothetical protein
MRRSTRARARSSIVVGIRLMRQSDVIV